jgi:integrase
MGAVRRADRAREWWVDFRFRGKRIRRPSPDQSKRGTLAFERTLRTQMVSDAEAGRNPFMGPAPLYRDFTDRWMRNYVAPRNRSTTIRDKDIILHLHLLPAFGHLRLDEISTAKIDAFVAAKVEQGMRPKTVNNYLTVLRASLSIAVEWGELRFVPRFHWQHIGEQPYRFLSDDECAGVLAAANSEFWRTFILFLLNTGTRFGEAAGLMWEDLVLDGPAPVVHVRRAVARGRLGQTKTGRPRDIPLNSAAVSAMSVFPRTGPYVFQRCAPKFMDPGSTEKFLYKFCRAAGLKPFGWHTFRHTFATALTSRGVPLVVVRDLLGHTDIKMTERYAHATPSATRGAVELLRTDCSDYEA